MTEVIQGTPYTIVLIDGPCVGGELMYRSRPDHRILIETVSGATIDADRGVPDLRARRFVYERVDHIGLAYLYRFLEEEPEEC